MTLKLGMNLVTQVSFVLNRMPRIFDSARLVACYFIPCKALLASYALPKRGLNKAARLNGLASLEGCNL